MYDIWFMIADEKGILRGTPYTVCNSYYNAVLALTSHKVLEGELGIISNHETGNVYYIFVMVDGEWDCTYITPYDDGTTWSDVVFNMGLENIV